MKTFFDANVIIAACLEAHEHHERALALLERVLNETDYGVTSAHALAEAYAVMTRLPKPLRVTPQQAALLLSENFLKQFEIVQLSGKAYVQLIITAGQSGWIGGLMYDAIHVNCAVKAAVDRLYSWNADHLKTVAPEAFRSRIMVP